MGGNSPSHFPHEGDDGGGVVFMKGIRLSDKVIKRMRQSSTVTSPRTSQNETPTLDSTPSVEHLIPPPPPPPSSPCPPPQVAPSSAAPSVKLLPPPPVKFHSLPPPPVEPAATSPTLPDLAVSAPPSPQTETPVSPPPVESFVPPRAERETPPKVPVTEPIVLPPPVLSSTADPPEPPSSPLPPEPVKPTAAVEPSSMPPSVEPVVSLTPQVEKVQPSPTVDSTLDKSIFLPANSAPDDAGVSPVHESEVPPPGVMLPGVPPPPLLLDASSSDPELTTEEPSPHCHCSNLAILPTDTPMNEPHTAPPLPNPAPPAEQPTFTTPSHHVEDEVPAKVFPVSPKMTEEELRQKIKEEMQRSLEEEISQRRRELQQQLEEMRSQAQAEAKAAAQAQVKEEVKRTLEVEKAAYMENLTDSIMKERLKTEDQKLMVQLYWLELRAEKLEEKEKYFKKQDTLYKEHIAKLEAKCTEFYTATAESFQKGKEETHNRFMRFSIQPVCGDLQSQVLKCYRENTGKTLTCSSIASAYMQCVDDAKKNKLSTRG